LLRRKCMPLQSFLNGHRCRAQGKIFFASLLL
jgi:hypothetical protein